MADDKVKIDIRRRRQEPTIYDKNSLYLISDIGDENFVLIVTDPEGNPKKIEAEDLREYAKLADLPETSTLQELLDTVPEDIGKLQTPFRLNEWADSKYALKNHTHIWGDITDRPTKLTDFQNDIGNYGDWITEDDLDGYATEDWVEGKGYITSYEDTTYTAGEGLDLDDEEFSLKQYVLDAIEEAHTHPNKGILDDITSADIDNWNEEYELPVSTNTDLGGVKVGDGLSITLEGVLSANEVDLSGYATEDWANTTFIPQTHPSYSITDILIGEWNIAFTKSHDHINKSLLDVIVDTDIENWDEAYSNTHTHANKNVLDGIASSDITNWNNKIDENFADTKYTLNTVEVRGTNGLTGGGALTTNRNIELSADTITNISKGVAAHAHTLDDITSNGNVTNTKMKGSEVFSNTMKEDYAQIKNVDDSGWRLLSLQSEMKIALTAKDGTTVLSSIDVSWLASGDLAVTIDDTDPENPELVFSQGGIEVARIPASTLLSGVVRGGNLSGYKLQFKDGGNTVLFDIDLEDLFDQHYTKNEAVSRFALRAITIEGEGSLTGGGNLTDNRTIDLTATAKSDIALGKTAHGWGNFRDFGLGKYVSTVGSDLDNLIGNPNTGFYRFTDTQENRPFSYGNLIHISKDSSEGTDLAIPFLSGGNQFHLKYRGINNGVGRKWIKVWDDSNLPNPATESWVNNQGFITDLSNYYTKTESLSQFVGLSGVQTINSTKTFTSSPVVPLGTLGSHAARLSQITGYGIGRKSTNLADITSEDIQYGRIFRSTQSGHTGGIISLPFDGSGSGRTNLFRVYNGKAWISASLVSEGTAPSWNELWHTGNLDPSEYSKTNHTHTWAQVSGKPATATRWPTWAEVTSKPAINSTGTVSNSIVQRDGTKINTAGGFFETSDKRLKAEIEEISLDLKDILKIPTVSYKMKGLKAIGTIAQEVQKIEETLVNTDEDGMLSVNYAKLSILAIKAIKELTERVHKLEKKK